MNRPKIVMGALLGVLLTAPLTGLMYLANQLADLSFAPFDVFNWFSRVLPGPVITFGIDLMIDTFIALGMSVADTAKTAEQVMALGMFLGTGLAFGGLFFGLAHAGYFEPGSRMGKLVGILFGLPGLVIALGFGSADVSPFLNGLWLLVLFALWSWALNRSYTGIYPAEPPADPKVEALNRRQFLIMMGGSAAAITVAGAGLGALLRDDELDDILDHGGDSTNIASFPNADDPVVPAPGTRPEYTPLKDHYQVFLELEPTEIDGEMWRLPVTGLVDNPLLLTIDDLRNNFEPVSQFVTLSCISGRIGTSLISTTLWSGLLLSDLLDTAQLQDDARYLIISSGDGFHETLDLELLEEDPRIMLAYDWDGNPIPVGHGFPLRIWIPDRYGMKQPKWITSIEVTDTYQEGYWVERGWDEVAQTKTTSVIDTVAVKAAYEMDGQTLVPVGGIAFAGARGISKVEVRVDGGEWQAAQLRTPLSDTTWVLWRYEWPFEDGEHLFEVRCAEGDGTPMIEEPSDNRPSGATGIHAYTLDG